MLAKPTVPMIPTVFDVRLRRPEGAYSDALFSGWGVDITGNRRIQ